MTTTKRYFRKPLALLVLAALAASVMMVVLASPAWAAAYTVDRSDDPDLTTTPTAGDCTDAANDCSLRGAINAANASTGVADTIGFDPALSGQTITLASTLDVTTDSGGLTIDGEDAEITVSGGGSVRVLSVASGATLDLRNLTVAGGFTNDNLGGGIHNAGTLTVTNSTISDNRANLTLGGGIVNAGTLTVTNSTFSGNSAVSAGGAIYTHANSLVTVTNSTFSGNLASRGDDIHNSGVTSNVALRNTIVASSRNNNCSNPVTDNGGNLDDGTTCRFTASTSKSNTPAGLDPAGLQPNGGPTETIALCSGVGTPVDCTGPSAAIDAAVNCPPPTTDQRGVSRPQGSACDIGAFELDTTPPSVTINQASGQADPTTDSTIHFTAVFNEPVTDFTDSDVTLSGTAGATTADVTEIAPNDGTTYDVAVSGRTTNGTVIASIPANAAKDIALNGNTASTSTDNTVTFNAPTVPMKKADCKKGGWRGLGWPDQGTCITAFNENRP
jgi:predicted outer membrane repeat protein